jgi:hypothetical protein
MIGKLLYLRSSLLICVHPLQKNLPLPFRKRTHQFFTSMVGGTLVILLNLRTRMM